MTCLPHHARLVPLALRAAAEIARGCAFLASSPPRPSTNRWSPRPGSRRSLPSGGVLALVLLLGQVRVEESLVAQTRQPQVSSPTCIVDFFSLSTPRPPAFLSLPSPSLNDYTHMKSVHLYTRAHTHLLQRVFIPKPAPSVLRRRSQTSELLAHNSATTEVPVHLWN